jgi:hypothetical protein
MKSNIILIMITKAAGISQSLLGLGHIPDNGGIRIKLPSEKNIFLFLYSIQTGFEAYSASYTMGTSGSFIRSKECQPDQSCPPSTKTIMYGATYLHAELFQCLYDPDLNLLLAWS